MSSPTFNKAPSGEVRRGDLAFSAHGILGLVLRGPRARSRNGKKTLYWEGIRLSDLGRWTSSSPEVVGRVENPEALITTLRTRRG